MRISKKIIIPVTSCLTAVVPFQPQAQMGSLETKYHTINWNTDNGLMWGRVNTMIKDKDGFLWITSEYGLDQFDGYRFIKHFPDKTKPGSLVGGPVRALTEDSSRNIWIGTDNGLSRYDKKAGTFTNFKADESDQD